MNRIWIAKLLSFFLLLVPNGVLAQENITVENNNRTQAIIQAAVEAHGGAEKLDAMNTVVVEHESTVFAINQSVRPGPPWDESKNRGISALSFEQEYAYFENKGAQGGFEFHSSRLLRDDENYQIDYRGKSKSVIAEPNYNQSIGPFVRVTAPLLIRELNQRSFTARFLGEVRLNNKKHDVISFNMEVGPAISLYFDTDTHLLSKSERVLGAAGLVEYWFEDYRQSGGVSFNRKFSFDVNGQPNMIRVNKKNVVNGDFNKAVSLPKDLHSLEAISPAEFTRQKVARNVYHIGGAGTYAMFIELEDYVVAVGGTAGIEQRIESLREVVPSKPIKYAVMTHHHNDHLVGVPDYEKNDAIMVAHTSHEQVVRSTAQDQSGLNMELIDTHKELGDATTSVRIIDVGPTAHSEHLLIAYLPGENIVFQADSFNTPAHGYLTPAVSSTRTFAKSLKRYGIEFDRMYSAHSAIPSTPEELAEALSK